MKLEKEKLLKIGKIFLIVILTIFLGISAWKELANESFERTKKWLVTNTQEKPELQKILDSQAFFATETVPIRNRTIFKISYKKPEKPTAFWVILEKEVGNITRIISHPLIENLTWNKIENGEYTIYQRNNDFNNVEEFFNSINSNEDILIEDFLESENEAINKAKFLTLAESLEGINYIVFNYRQVYQEGGLSVYETLIDASEAKLENNKIFWGIFMPEVCAENPIELKIDIDFSQPSNIIIEN